MSGYRARVKIVASLTRLFCFFLVYGSASAMAGQSDSVAELAEPLAEKVVEKSAPRLRSEGAKAIMISVGTCEVNGGAVISRLFCERFREVVEREFVNKRGIAQLPKEQSDQIRNDMAKEVTYQSGSMMVNPDMAAKIGEQYSVSAMVQLDVKQISEFKMQATIKSLNLTKGVVTIQDDVKIEYSATTKSRTWTQTLVPWSIAGVGFYGAYASYAKSEEYEKHARTKYASYQSTESSSEAASYREETKSLDEKSSLQKDIAYGCAAIGVASVVYYFWSGQDSFEYKVTANDRANESGVVLRFEPSIWKSSLTLSYQKPF